MNTNDWIAFDVETIGDKEFFALQPWRADNFQANIRTWAFAYIAGGKFVSNGFRYKTREDIVEFLKYCAKNNKVLVGWNVAFDIAWLCAIGLREYVFDCQWLDGMLMWKAFDKTRKKYGLKEAVTLFIPGQAGYEEDVDFEGDIDRLIGYNQDDCKFTLYLALMFWKQLTPREQNAVLIGAEDLPVVGERNYKGLPIARQAVFQIHAYLDGRRQAAYNKILPHIPPGLQLDKKSPVGINLDSDQQCAKLLHEYWGVPVFKQTPKGKPSVDKESLLELAHQDERARWLKEYRETTGLISKMVKAPIEAIMYNKPDTQYVYPDIIHSTQNKGGTYTGRSTYSSKIKPKPKKKVAV